MWNIKEGGIQRNAEYRECGIGGNVEWGMWNRGNVE